MPAMATERPPIKGPIFRQLSLLTSCAAGVPVAAAARPNGMVKSDAAKSAVSRRVMYRYRAHACENPSVEVRMRCGLEATLHAGQRDRGSVRARADRARFAARQRHGRSACVLRTRP